MFFHWDEQRKVCTEKCVDVCLLLIEWHRWDAVSGTLRCLQEGYWYIRFSLTWNIAPPVNPSRKRTHSFWKGLWTTHPCPIFFLSFKGRLLHQPLLYLKSNCSKFTLSHVKHTLSLDLIANSGVICIQDRLIREWKLPLTSSKAEFGFSFFFLKTGDVKRQHSDIYLWIKTFYPSEFFAFSCL